MKALLLSVILIAPFLLHAKDFNKLISKRHKEAEELLEADWFKNELKKSIAKSEKFDLSEIKERNKQILESSRPCFSQTDTKENYPIVVFLSFAAPTSLWLEYSESLEKVEGAIVVRGLPNDSFQAFANKIFKLRKKGVRVPISLDPKLFEKHNIEFYPTIMSISEDKVDKISGSISLEYALELFARQEENP